MLEAQQQVWGGFDKKYDMNTGNSIEEQYFLHW